MIKYTHTYIHTGGVHGVMVSAEGNGYGDVSSNPGWNCLFEMNVCFSPSSYG